MSAKLIIDVRLRNRKSGELLTLGECEKPAGAQIFGDDPEIMAKAALKAMEFSPGFSTGIMKTTSFRA